MLAAAECGDRRAAEVVATVSGHLAHGLTILGACLDPAEVVLGGGLGCDPRLVKHVRHALAEFGTHVIRAQVAVTPAELGARAGLVGAADLARGQAVSCGSRPRQSRPSPVTLGRTDSQDTA
ncbi:ROK family protein [Lentzea guizhouensis]|uniref:ROK family protein n=1 Tax=Lentzea guizhouensis TaxID=1586287 RepID=UPI003AAE1989